jgi:uncharacterized protein (TIGR03083 family)
MDAADIYADVRSRMIDLALATPADALAGQVPATPAWTGRQLIAHMVGIPSDVLAGRLDGVGSDEWSARQVAEREGKSVEELADEWRSTAEAFDGLVRSGPPGMTGALVADIAQHELDLRGLLDQPAPDACAAAVDFGLNTMVFFLDKRVKKAELGALRLNAGNQEWTVGPGESEPVATLTTTPTELFRVIAGRRSAAQVRALDWSGDPEPYLPLLSAFGSLAATDVHERLEDVQI